MTPEQLKEALSAALDKSAPSLETFERHYAPIVEGCLDYFPYAIMAVSMVSKIGNDKHNPGQPMHWARDKSTDQRDCLVGHTMRSGTFMPGCPVEAPWPLKAAYLHDTAAAWRALAQAQTVIEKMFGLERSRASK